MTLAGEAHSINGNREQCPSDYDVLGKSTVVLRFDVAAKNI
jgi:hypothetical protein